MATEFRAFATKLRGFARGGAPDLQLATGHDHVGRLDLAESGGEPEREYPAVVRVDLGDEVGGARRPGAPCECLDGRATHAAAPASGHDRELRDVPAVVAHADHAETHDGTVGQDEKRQALRLLPVCVEVGIRLGPPVELEQVVGEQPPELLAVLERGFAQRDVHDAMMPPVGEPELQESSDGVVTLRPPRPGDAQLLVAGRDEEFQRWLGPGSETPNPTACIWVGEEVVGWIDYDVERDWLQPGEVNVGYYLFPAARGRGYASRAVELLLSHLSRNTPYTAATLVIHPENVRSLRLARRLGFMEKGEVERSLSFVREV